MKILFIIISLLLVQTGLWGQYDKLNKKYNADRDACLAYAKKQISKGPKDSYSYYFVARIYRHEYQKASGIKKKYTTMNQTMMYGLKFESKASEEEKALVNWKVFLAEISEEYISLIAELDKEQLYDKVTKLEHKFNKLIGTAEVNTAESKELARDITNYDTETKHGKYFGLPTGKENITSSNLKGEQEVLKFINEERKQKGMQPLVWNENLARAARYHAYDMGTQGYFEHDSYDAKEGKKPYKVADTFDRIKQFYKEGFANSENIAGGSSEPYQTYMQWYNSPGHYANMFNPDSKYVGIGNYSHPDSDWGDYWVFCTGR